MSSSLNYTKIGDYQLPNLTLSQPKTPLGKYGRMRRNYLKQYRPVLYNSMLLNGTLYPHLMELEQTTESRMQQMMAELLKQNPAPGQSAEPTDVGAAHEQSESASRGTGDDGADLQLVFWMPSSPPKPSKLKESTKRRAKKRPPLLFCHRLKSKTNCVSMAQDLRAVSSALWHCTRPSLTENSVPKHWQRSTASVVIPTIFWTEVEAL